MSCLFQLASRLSMRTHSSFSMLEKGRHSKVNPRGSLPKNAEYAIEIPGWQYEIFKMGTSSAQYGPYMKTPSVFNFMSNPNYGKYFVSECGLLSNFLHQLCH